MNNLNSLILEGRVLENAQLQETLDGSAICNFFIGVSHSYKKSSGETVEEVSDFSVSCYGAMARAFTPKLTKGAEIRIVGYLKLHKWKDKEGKNYSRVVVVAEHIEIRK